MSKSKKELDVKKIVQEFDRSESEKPIRKGSFKINAEFEQAMKSILKAKPGPKKDKKGG